MSNDLKKYFCPRLIDFIIITGCKQPLTPSQLITKQIAELQQDRKIYEDSLPLEFHDEKYKKHNEQNSPSSTDRASATRLPPAQLPELLRRYPLDDHKDFMLPQDVTYFCQPEGCININCSGQEKANSHKDSTSFIFMLTEKDSSRVRYGVCINFFRPIEKKYEQQRKNSRRQRKKERKSKTSTVSDNDEDQETSDEKDNQFEPKKRRNKKASDVKYTHTLTTLCIISHHPFFSIFRECLNILRRIIEACHARSLASKPGTPTTSSDQTSSFGKSPSSGSLSKSQQDTVWGILTGSSGTISTDQISSLIACEIREIETWILRLLSAPVPVPGKTKLIIDILPNESPMLFALPDHTRFDLVDFPLHLPLELLGVDLCVQVITLILLENKLLFQSSDYNALTMSIMAFVAMLYPLEYMFPIIPLLPRVMKETEQLLFAPTPFIIGVPSSFLQYRTNFQVPDDVWIVDLDKNKIIPPRNCEPVCEPPEPELSLLKRHLNQILQSLSSSPQPVKNFENFFNQQHMYAKSNKEHLDLISKSFSPLMYGNDVDSVDVATRISMVQFLTSKNILGNFGEHTRTLRLYPRPVVAFQYNSFIRSRPIKSEFIFKLGKSQAVEFLAEWSLCPSNVAYLRVQTGIFDPSLIGDKAKWYCRYLTPVQFKTYEEKTTLAAAIHFYNQETIKAAKNNVEILTDDSVTSEQDDLDSYYNSSSSLNEASLSQISSSVKIENQLGTIKPNELDTLPPLPDKAPVFTSDGRPIGMFPKNQATTMCVDVISVYTPPVETGFKEHMSASVESSNSESSAITSSASSSSSITSFHKQKSRNAESQDRPNSDQKTNDDNSIGSKETDSKSCLTDSEHASDNYEEDIFMHDNQTEINKNSNYNSLVTENKREPQPTVTSVTLTATEAVTKKTISSTISLLSQLSDVTTKAKNLSSMAVANIQKQRFSSLRERQDETGDLQTTTDTNNNLPSKVSGMKQSHSTGMGSLARPEKPSDSQVERYAILTQTQSVNDLNSDNQQFLKEVLGCVLEGQGVGWLKLNRVKRLMEDENNRNFILSRLNTSLNRKLSNDEQHIEDVKVTRAVFKGMAKLLATIVYGLESTYANNGLGGMASAFQLLEIAHTHYWLHGDTDSPNQHGHTDGAMSPMSEQSNSPYASHENLNTIDTQMPSVNSVSSQQSQQQQQFEIQSTGSIVTQLDPPIKQASIQNNSAQPEIKQIPISQTSSNNDLKQHVSKSVKPQIKHHVINRHQHDTSPENQSSITSGISSSHSTTSSLKKQSSGELSSLSIASTAKSQISSGYRYTKGCLVEAPTHIQTTPGSNPVKVEPRMYLFETLLNKNRSKLWDQLQFWEDVFLDAVSQERDIIGLDQGPSEMMERYNLLGNAEKKRLELDEDHLLAVMLYNLIAFMIMMKVNKDELRRKVRRMLGKCHIGLVMSQQVNDLLDCINYISGNDADIRPAGSRIIQKQSFTVHIGTDNKSDMLFMEVCDDCMILRSVKGEILERWFFEKLVNMTYCPKTKNLCLWCQQDGETKLNTFYTKKCRELYYTIKDAMEKAVSRLEKAVEKTDTPSSSDLGGEFPIMDLVSEEIGALQVSMEGIGLMFEAKKEFIELKRVRKCTTQKDDIFVLEEFDPKLKQIVVRKYKSKMASRAIFAFHRVISVLMTKKING